MLCYLLAVPATLLLMLQGPLLLLAALLQPLSQLPILWGILTGTAVSYTVAALVALLCVHLEGKSVRRLWKPILLFPLFMLPMGFMAVAAAIHPRVAWKPIVHRRASTIDDVLKS